MAQTTFSVRMDETIKRQFDDFCRTVGMNTSTAFNLFARAVLREKRLPFEIAIEADPFYGESNITHLRRGITALNEGKVITKTLTELREME